MTEDAENATENEASPDVVAPMTDEEVCACKTIRNALKATALS